MEIIRTYVPNSLANYNHLVYCPTTQQAAAIDPFDADHIVDIAKQHSLNISQIWLTHEHGDHIRGLTALRDLTGAQTCAPMTCNGLFESDIWLEDAQEIRLGEETVTHYLTPGHTPGHGVFLYQHPTDSERDFLVCADTLFNAGVGNTRSGNVNELYQTVNRLKSLLRPQTQLFPGHDYICTNLKFVLNHFPNCDPARTTLDTVDEQTPDTRSVMRLSDEYRYNPFLSLQADWIEQHDDFAHLTQKERFFELRSRRDQW